MNAPYRKPSESPAPRIAPLPKLPVFYDLVGKPVIVVGGSSGAAWKAELLAAAGADVRVLAGDAGTGMVALAESARTTGSLRVEARAWSADDFRGVAMVVADAASDTEAAGIATAARAAGAPVNIVDRPAFCDFQFGAIVNRAPVVVAISTDGAAPVLGQAIRRRIETLLPRSIGRWAVAVKGLRQRVAGRMVDPAARRAFWERFADIAFAREPGDSADRELAAMIDGVAGRTRTGSVTLVGAGPGDAEYLTLKAVRALQSADVILFDDLVSDEVLDLARREAKRMLVGKRGGRPSCRQEDINALMVKLARQGKRVVRLKAGDPMIFGRAGEEIARLEAAGIPVEVVPGITAASAMAARLGVSLTHRDHAQSVRYVTGHGKGGALPSEIDWRLIADPAATTVFYMGGRYAAAIAGKLIEHGLPATTPVAIMSSISRADESRWSGTLADLLTAPARTDGGPVLIGVGRVWAAAAAAAAVQVTAERRAS